MGGNLSPLSALAVVKVEVVLIVVALDLQAELSLNVSSFLILTGKFVAFLDIGQIVIESIAWYYCTEVDYIGYHCDCSCHPTRERTPCQYPHC